MSRKSILKAIGSISLSAVLLLETTLMVGAASLAERLNYTDDTVVTDILYDTYYYSKYLEDNKFDSAVGYENSIDIFSYIDGNPLIYNDQEKGAVIHTTYGNGDVTYNISVPQDGMYQIFVDFYCIDGNSQSVARGIKIDGEYPFEEAKNVFLQRSFLDEGVPKTNNLGDETMPSQVEIRRWKTSPLYDNGGMYGEALKFALTAGQHTLTFEYINQPVLISKIVIKGAETAPTYKELKAEYKQEGYKKANESIRFEAESYDHVYDKSASSILIASDSNSEMTPLSITSRKYNGIGGSTWAKGGMSISWKFEVKEAGLYKLALRSVQNANAGISAHRRIEIDGEVPFSEMYEYVFPYDAKWQTNTISNGDEPYLFYLDKGEHILTMTAVNGSMTDIIHKINRANSMLSNCYQNIVMVTGQSPDLNYDYELDKSIPAIISNINDIIDVLRWCITEVQKHTNRTATIENSIRQAIETLQRYADDVDAIPAGLTDFTSTLTNMGEWLSTVKTQSLFVDYITFTNPDEDLPNPQQNFWDLIINTFKNLILSYTKDYNAVGSLNGETEGRGKDLEVWLSKSKEWAEILKDLADSEFALENDVNLKVNLLPEGAFAGTVNTLLLAVNAGTEPDVVLNMNATNTVEYAIRGAITDLASFEDFKEYKKYTIDELYIPISYDGKVYGLPETIGFKSLIYRTDLFEKLNIPLPNTWDDVYDVMLPKLYQNNLEMYIPASFNIFLYQNGGQLYTDDGRKSALDSDSSFRAFDQFIGNYKDYGFPYHLSFLNRFRTGETPIGIGTMAEYLSIAYGASELSGKWAIAPIPAMVQEDGTLNRSSAEALGTVSLIMETSTEKETAWKFLKWWMSKETQTEYGQRIESVLGMSARWPTANIEAFKNLPWSAQELEVIQESWNWIVEAPYVPGGYFTSRHMSNAISRCMTGGYKPRESLEQSIEQINIELERKRADLGLD